MSRQINRVGGVLLCLAGALYANTAWARQPAGIASAPAAESSPGTPKTNGAAAAPGDSAPNQPNGIPAGTEITMRNWRQYRQFMPDGMAALFQGGYHWKMPADVEIRVGPTIIHPLPKPYLDATEKYAAQAKIVELPDGGTNLQGYAGGQPFPNPRAPRQGWKILANVWYRYLPHLFADTYGTGCMQNSLGNINCTADQIVGRQLSYNTDPGVSSHIAGAGDKFYTEWIMTLEPENQKYTADLVISYADLSKPQAVYVFIPSLRRAQPISATARCTPYSGTDFTADDYRFGFNADLTEMKVDYLGEKRILALVDAQLPDTRFPGGYYMPLGWPKPSWGRWQVREVYVISASKIPAKAAGYCYGKRVMYVDKAFSSPLWEDLYDANLKPWKFYGVFFRTMDVPGLGPVNSSGSAVEALWDIQNNHTTIFSDPGMGRPLYINEQAPQQYQDLTRYTTLSGLNAIMR